MQFELALLVHKLKYGQEYWNELVFHHLVLHFHLELGKASYQADIKDLIPTSIVDMSL